LNLSFLKNSNIFKEQLLSQLGAGRSVKGIDAYKYCGVLTLKESPEEIQKKVRGEWD